MVCREPVPGTRLIQGLAASCNSLRLAAYSKSFILANREAWSATEALLALGLCI